MEYELTGSEPYSVRMMNMSMAEFYGQFDELAGKGASFESTKQYLQKKGMNLEPVLQSTRMKVKPFGSFKNLRSIDDAVDADSLVSVELEQDPNTVVAYGKLPSTGLPIMLMVSYAKVPLEAMENNGIRYQGIIEQVPHVAVTAFVGGGFYQRNWIVSGEIDQTIAARKPSRIDSAAQSESAMRI